MSTQFTSVLHEVEFLLSERRELMASGPTFRIVCKKPSCSYTSEEIAMIVLNYRGQEFLVRLSITGRKIFGYLAQHQHVPQSAIEISNGVRRESGHACQVGHRSIKQCVRRIRLAIRCALSEAGLNLDAEKVLLSEATEGNTRLYRLKAKIEWDDL